MTTIGATSSTAHSSSNGHVPDKSEVYSSVDDLSMDQQRSRSDSSASALLGDATPITVTAPGSTVPRPLKLETGDLVQRRLREALAEAGKRGATHVNLDQEFVQTILMVLEQRRVEHAELKGKLDHIRVRAVMNLSSEKRLTVLLAAREPTIRGWLDSCTGRVRGGIASAPRR